MQHLRLLRLWDGHRHLFLALVLVGLAVAGTWSGQALLTSRVFAALVSGSASGGDLAPALLALAAVLLARPLLVLARQLLAQHAMTLVKASLRSRALRAFVRRSALDPGAGRAGRDHAVVVDGIENLDAYLSGYLPQVGVSAVVVAAVGSMMVAVDPVTGLVATAAALALPTLPRLWDKVLASRGSDHWDAYQELHAEFVDSMHGMTTLVAFGADRRRESQLARASELLLRRTLGQLRISLIESGLSGFALAAVPAVVLVVVVLRRHELSALAVFTLVLLSAELVRPLRDLAALWHAGYLGTFSGPRVMDLLDDQAAVPHAPSRPDPVDSEGPVSAESARPSPLVRVRGLEVRYPRTESRALADVDLDIRAGLTAVVGGTGSGKSTLAACLVGLLHPDAGTVEINGRALDPDELLERVTLVPQDPVLLGATVGQDIALGLPRRAEQGADSGSPLGQEVRDAARTAGIGSDASLSLDSPTGEAGSRLSGGQRQRVAIARGLAQQRDVIILDEATSALDPASEAGLVTALRERPERVVIAITHRLDVARAADHVIVMAGGRVVEQGTAEDLEARHGTIERLIAAGKNSTGATTEADS